MLAVAERSLQDRALEALRRAGNPFRNYFARNPDDDVCSRYHVADLYAREREQLLALVDLYRYDGTMHSEVVPVLGNKGSGKTHLLHTIKHGEGVGRQLLVTPGTYQKGADFLEYVLFQIIDTLLGGGKQRGARPLAYLGEELTRKLLRQTLETLDARQRLDLFPAPALARWARRLGLGSSQAEERTQWLIDTLAKPTVMTVRQICAEVNLDLGHAATLIGDYLTRSETHNTVGLMRRKIHHGFVQATLLGQENHLAEFLTDGFAAAEGNVRPSRHDQVLALTKALMDVFLTLKVPVVVAFDQLEDLLLVRRTEDAHKASEAFFAGIVQALHQIDGICFLIFAERGLWNRFVPSLDGYIQDRLNNPVHVPKFGTVQTLRLEAPPPHLVWQVVAARMRPTLEELPDFADLSPIHPFTDDQVARVARTEPTLRDMLQQFRRLFDHLVYGVQTSEGETAEPATPAGVMAPAATPAYIELPTPEEVPPEVKSVAIVEALLSDPVIAGPAAPPSFAEVWAQEMRLARLKLEPEGALTGAAREMQAGLGAFLRFGHEHGVKAGAWRLQHVVPDFTFGDHPTYGVLSIAHWVRKDGKPWRVGVGLFMGRGPGKPKDLQVKMTAFDGAPPVIDSLILLRPADDAVLSGKSKALWDEAAAKQRHARLEPVQLDEFAILYGFPRWLTAVTESLPEGQPLPNLADFLQSRCERLLEQVCLPSS
jgi:hypothetical protein